MARALFVTGTDTGVGKTRISLGLMRALQECGLRVAGMKPVASGCRATRSGLRNADAVALQRQSSVAIPYEWVNPYHFAPPVAPHLAAADARVSIDLQTVRSAFDRVAGEVDWVVVEGIGGWLVPLGPELCVADVALALEATVVLVVRIRLGCLNHALLTWGDVERRGAEWGGWIANLPDPQCLRALENVAALETRLRGPRLALVPRLSGRRNGAAEHLRAAVSEIAGAPSLGA